MVCAHRTEQCNMLYWFYAKQRSQSSRGCLTILRIKSRDTRHSTTVLTQPDTWPASTQLRNMKLLFSANNHSRCLTVFPGTTHNCSLENNFAAAWLLKQCSDCWHICVVLVLQQIQLIIFLFYHTFNRWHQIKFMGRFHSIEKWTHRITLYQQAYNSELSVFTIWQTTSVRILCLTVHAADPDTVILVYCVHLCFKSFKNTHQFIHLSN